MLIQMGNESSQNFPVSWELERAAADGSRQWVGRVSLDHAHMLTIEAGGDERLAKAMSRLNATAELHVPFHDPQRPYAQMSLGTPRGHADFPDLLRDELRALGYWVHDQQVAESGVSDG
jgi:hypothetical protein